MVIYPNETMRCADFRLDIFTLQRENDTICIKEIKTLKYKYRVDAVEQKGEANVYQKHRRN